MTDPSHITNRPTAPVFTNPFELGSKNWTRWEATGTKTLSAPQARLVTSADAAYDREEQAWFNALSTPDLVMLWGLVSGINMLTSAGSWDDEVYDALHSHGYDFAVASN
jgi:hypothetical protein